MNKAVDGVAFLQAAIVVALLLGGLISQSFKLDNYKAELETIRKQAYLEGYRDGIVEALKGTGNAELIPLVEELQKAGKL